MIANKTLLQRKYTRLIILYAKRKSISLREALEYFYNSYTYIEMQQGISDMHCRSDEYLVEELIRN